MAYVLEKITPTDQAKIIRDAELSLKERSSLVYARDKSEFANTWAIDREHNYYLLMAPISTREDVTNRPYYFFHKNSLYRIFREGWFGHTFRFNEPAVLTGSALEDFQSEIGLAFAVYGESGTGPLNESGAPEFAVVPVFKVGA